MENRERRGPEGDRVRRDRRLRAEKAMRRRQRSEKRTADTYRRRSGGAGGRRGRLHGSGNGAGGRSFSGSHSMGGVPGRRWIKLAAILAGVCLLGVLLYGTIREIVRPGPEGEYLTLQEAANLTWLLADTAGMDTEDLPTDPFVGDPQQEGGGMLTFGAFKQIVALFEDSGYELPDYYRDKDRVLLTDWYAFFDRAREVCDGQGRIRDMDLVPLGMGGAVTDGDGEILGEQELISMEKRYSFLTDRMKEALYRPAVAVEREGVLYALRALEGPESSISNIWIMEVEEDALRCFWNDYEVRIDAPAGRGAQLGALREQVADLRFADGMLSEVHMRTEKVSGRLLKIRDNGAEIEGVGFLPFAQQLRIYRLYERLKRYYTSDLRIGYDFADFVVENGEIQAALVVKEEAMETIRVLVKNSDYGGALHDAVELLADCDLTVRAGENEQLLPAGQTLRIDRDSQLFEEGRIRIDPAVLTGRISILNLSRSQGAPSYRGSLELERQENGIVVLNEVLLEEYLYAVVPSEMPSTYPLEALKAQAVCARTYAYRKMLHAGLPAYGAHVDDSSGFQVYNNVAENAETTKAVKETAGELLYYREEPAETYYYSTSCGYGTDTAIWQNSVPEEYPYLQARAVNVAGVTDAQGDTIDGAIDEADIRSAEDMRSEEAFAAFIRGTRESDFESDEAWYRWSYRVETLDSALLYENVRKRYEAVPGTVYVRMEDGSFQNQEPVDPGRIREIYIAARNTGGVAQELVIEGENATLMLRTEHNVRYVLSNNSSSVIRQDGSEFQPGTLLPSAFLTVETTKQDGFVTGYTLYGGGFGHGVGLSQNGARSMARDGCDSDNILAYFYEGSEIRKIYSQETDFPEE